MTPQEVIDALLGNACGANFDQNGVNTYRMHTCCADWEITARNDGDHWQVLSMHMRGINFPPTDNPRGK